LFVLLCEKYLPTANLMSENMMGASLVQGNHSLRIKNGYEILSADP